MEINRREFLKLLGVSTAATAVGVWSGNTIYSIPENVFERALSGAHIETWKNSVCSMCPAGCGIRVRLIDDIPVRIKGNPLYPVNRGASAVCPMAEAGVEMLFHPDRIRQPLKRAGRRGENQWEPISWDEALRIITRRMQKLLRNKEPEKLVMMTRDYNDMMSDLARYFMKTFNSPNFICLSDTNISSLPSWLTQGIDEPPVYDLANTNYVLNFGGDFLDEGPSPVHFNQIYASLRNRENHQKAQIIHISSYMSRTAAQSTRWLPIKPGTMAALALSIANVMIRDETYNKNFINNYAFGFSKWKDADGNWHKGFKELVSEEYYPEKVAQITGLPAAKIIETARDFALSDPALAISGRQATATTNSFYTLWAIYCLNALKGNFEKPGGILFPQKRMLFSAAEGNNNNINHSDILRKPSQTKMAITNFSASKFEADSFAQLLSALKNKQPAPVDTLFFYRVNPLFESTNQKEYSEALQEVPFIVTCNSFIDETSAVADLILPINVFLEDWNVSRNTPAVEFSHFGVQQPVITPLYDSQSFGDVLLQIGRRLGNGITKSFPWKDYKEFIQAQVLEIYNSGEGTVISESVDLSWIEFLKNRGWQVFEYSTFDEFWNVLLEKGGWWDPFSTQSQNGRIYKTHSPKFEFYSQALQKEINKQLTNYAKTPEQAEIYLSHLKIDARGDMIFLPHFEAPRFNKNDMDFPYHFLTYSIITNINGFGNQLALLQEFFGLYSREYWNSWAEVNPETATKLGIKDGDTINIISGKGRISVKTKILPTVMPQVVLMPFGLGHKPGGRHKKKVGENPFRIFTSDTDLISGVPSLISTKVRIEKAALDELS